VVVVFVSRDKRVLSVILEQRTIDLKSLRKQSGVPERTLRNVLERLKKRGFIEEHILLSDLRRKVITANKGLAWEL
jgi:DNA-binding MarR family transcriptional regulator